MLLTLMMGGCDRARSGPAVEFVITHTDPVRDFQGTPGGLPPDPTVAVGGTGSIQVRGIIALPDQCDDVGANVEPAGAELTLRVVVRGSRTHQATCGPVDRVVMAQYEATVERLSPGPYLLRVVYDYRRVREREQQPADDSRTIVDLWQDHDAGEHRVQVR